MVEENTQFNANSSVITREKWDWTVPKLMAVSSLLEGKKIEEVARISDVSPSTIYEWKKNKIFLDALQFAREETRLRINDKIARGAELAVDKIIELISTGNNRQRVQLDAAQALLKHVPPIYGGEKDKDGAGTEVKIIVMNNTTIENRKPQIKDWEREMGYDIIDVEGQNFLGQGNEK